MKSARAGTAVRVAAALSLLFLAAGAIQQIWGSASAVDIHLHDTYFVIAHTFLFVAAALLFALFAIVHLSFPSLSHRPVLRRLALIHLVLTAVCFAVILWPVQYEGVAGAPHRYYDYSTWESFNQFQELDSFVSVAVVLLLTAQVLFVCNILLAIFGREGLA